MNLKVIKADGSVEEYLHTKIVGTINSAMSAAGQADIAVAQELAEVVTYFLHQKHSSRSVTSSEIFSIIEAVLAATGYEEAAAVLSEHHFVRKLRRSRIEVVLVDVQDLADAQMFCCPGQTAERSRWNKSRIVEDLITEYNVPRPTARAIASMVEERVLDMGATLVPASLVKQLVLSNTAAVLHAQRQLLAV
jgi:transcriptional regulator NrdR family protein